MTIYHLFSRQAKKKCWKIIEKFSEFLICFEMLCTSQEWHGDLFDQLEKCVCFVFGGNIRNISNLRSIKISAREEIWSKASERIQSSTFGFFTSLQAYVLLYHAKRTNLTAYSIWHMWRNLRQPIIAIPEIKDHW